MNGLRIFLKWAYYEVFSRSSQFVLLYWTRLKLAASMKYHAELTCIYTILWLIDSFGVKCADMAEKVIYRKLTFWLEPFLIVFVLLISSMTFSDPEFPFCPFVGLKIAYLIAPDWCLLIGYMIWHSLGGWKYLWRSDELWTTLKTVKSNSLT